MNLNYLRVFIEIAKQESLLGASKSLSMPNSTIGRHLSQLEEELGLNLIVRNTRHLSLTEEGKELYERTFDIIDKIEEVESDLLSQRQGLIGKIKIAIPNEFGAQWLSECLAQFTSKHPMVSIDCSTSMVSVDPIRKDMDVSIIYHRGIPTDSSLVMQNLIKMPSVIVGSPKLIAKLGVPKSVGELQHLPCISTLHALRSNPWHFTDRDGKCHSLSMNCRYRVDSSSMLIAGAVAGLGFAIIPLEFCDSHIRNNNLYPIHLDMSPAPLQLAAVFPNRRITTRTKALVDEIRETLICRIRK